MKTIKTTIATTLPDIANTKFTKEEFLKLLISINESLGENKLKEKVLARSFEKWWPDLNHKIDVPVEEGIPKYVEWMKKRYPEYKEHINK